MMSRNSVESIDAYIAEFPPDTRSRLQELRTLIAECAPEAAERISYGMPTFDLNRKHLVYFAGYERHIGFYPLPRAIEAVRGELTGYKTGKGSVQFPLDQPLPHDVIRRMVALRVQEMTGKGGR